ncbi:MAG TPA: hypothetical protein PL048_06370 [Leptospiraceae bacterium]|nr:hypothetical protein [Leptospiraceae bacterium]
MGITGNARHCQSRSRNEGKIEGKEEVALNGIRLGLSDNTIQELTGLSADEIKKLRSRF